MSTCSPPARLIESVAFVPLGDTQRKTFSLHRSVASLSLARGGEDTDASEYRRRNGRLEQAKGADADAGSDSDSSDEDDNDDDYEKHSQASAQSAAHEEDEPCKHLDSRVVSRMHARLSWRQGPASKGDGCSSSDNESKGSAPPEEADKRPMRLMLTDLKSTHGTYVSRLGQTTDIKLTPNREFELQDGDTITIGRQVEKSGEMFYAPKFTSIFSFTKPVKKEFFEECARASMQALLEKQKLEEEQDEEYEDYDDEEYEDDFYGEEEEEDYEEYLDELERAESHRHISLIDNDEDDVILTDISVNDQSNVIDLTQNVIVDLSGSLDGHGDAACSGHDDALESDDHTQASVKVTTAMISNGVDVGADEYSSSSSLDDGHATPETSDIEEKFDEHQGDAGAAADKCDNQENFTATEDVSDTASISGLLPDPPKERSDSESAPNEVAKGTTSEGSDQAIDRERSSSPILTKKRSAEAAQLDDQDEGHVDVPPRSDTNGTETTTASLSSPPVDLRPRKRLGFGAGVVAGVVVGAVGTFAGLSSLALDDNFLP